MVLSTHDYDIVQDLRELNGRPQSLLFDLFWSELNTLLESHGRVDDRRHGEYKFTCTMRIPFPSLFYLFVPLCHSLPMGPNRLRIINAGNVCFLLVVTLVRDLRAQVDERLTHQHHGGLKVTSIKIPSES